jgi:hypothetical protein
MGYFILIALFSSRGAILFCESRPTLGISGRAVAVGCMPQLGG